MGDSSSAAESGVVPTTIVRRVLLGTAFAGFIAAIGFRVASGLECRALEDRGIESAAPAWVAIGTYAGLALSATWLMTLAILTAPRSGPTDQDC